MLAPNELVSRVIVPSKICIAATTAMEITAIANMYSTVLWARRMPRSYTE